MNRPKNSSGEIIASGLVFLRLGEFAEFPFFDTWVKMGTHSAAGVFEPQSLSKELQGGPKPEIIAFSDYIKVEVHGLALHPNVLFNRRGAVIQLKSNEKSADIGLFTADIAASLIGEVVQLQYVFHWNSAIFQGPWREVTLDGQ